MAKFKAGDKVIYVGKGGKGVCDYPRTISSVERSSYAYEDGSRCFISEADRVGGDFELALVANTKLTYNRKNYLEENSMKKWSFNIISESQIDFVEIAKELTTKSPIITVSISGNMGAGYLLTHRSLVVKANEIGKDYWSGKDYWNGWYLSDGTAVTSYEDNAERESIIDSFKQVKAANWPDRNKAKVTVTMLEV
jgi:hypothetical protein